MTVLDKAGLQGPETGNREPVLGMGAKQGLEARSGGKEWRSGDGETDGAALRTSKP